MKFPNAASVCSIFLSTVLLIAGCSTKPAQTVQPVASQTTTPKTQPATTSAEQPTTQTQNQTQPQPDETPLDKACSQLESDFASEMAKITQGDKDKLNFVMSADRLNGLQAFNCHGQNFSSLIGANRDQVRQELQDSLIYSGYTTNGLHFMALVQSTRTTDEGYRPLMASLRNKDKEYQLLYDIMFQTGYRNMDGGFYAIDLYAEDLTGQKTDIPIDNLTIGDKSPITPTNKLLDEVLDQYHRSVGDIHKIRNKSWNLLLFPAGAVVTKNLPLVIDAEGQHIYLSNTWL